MIALTALILTYNEKENIARTLAALQWVPGVLLVDSGSDDGTVELARRSHPNVRVIQRAFDSFAGQCNFGLTQVATEWVISLDADYVLTEELSAEIGALENDDRVSGYRAAFIYNVFGYRLRSTVYPPRTVLYRRAAARYRNEGHGHRVEITGVTRDLRGKVDHDDRKPLSRWISAQDRYTKIEAKHLLELRNAECGIAELRNADGGIGELRTADCGRRNGKISFQDRLRLRVYFAAPVMFLYLLFGRMLILDGWPGWYYIMQRTIAELLLSLRLLTERHRLEERR